MNPTDRLLTIRRLVMEGIPFNLMFNGIVFTFKLVDDMTLEVKEGNKDIGKITVSSVLKSCYLDFKSGRCDTYAAVYMHQFFHLAAMKESAGVINPLVGAISTRDVVFLVEGAVSHYVGIHAWGISKATVFQMEDGSTTTVNVSHWENVKTVKKLRQVGAKPLSFTL